MRALHRLIARLRNFATGRRADQRLREEMEEHIAFLTAEYLRADMSPEEARRQAILKFGSIGTIRENWHEEEGLPWIEHLLQDSRFALRQLRKSPAFTAVAILTLALGIGANVAIFSLLHAILIRKLPVADPARLVRLGDRNDCCVGYGMPEDGDYNAFSTDAWEQLRKNTPEFEDLAAMQSGFESAPIIVRRPGVQQDAHPAVGEFVSGNYFRTFGLSPALGRLFTDSDDTRGATATAVLSYEAWKNNDGADTAVIGSTIFVNSRPVTIIGVAPQGFYGDRLSATPPDFYLPIRSMPVLANASFVQDPRAIWLYLIGRVRPGVPLLPLQAKLSSLLRQALAPTRTFTSEQNKSRLPKVHIVLTPGGVGIQSMRDDYSAQLYLLMSISGLVLLIACANVANLLLVRGFNRRAEMSVRCALGAMQSRLTRQLLTESLILALLCGLAGLAVAFGGTRLLLALAFPGDKQIPIHASPSVPALAFAFVLALLTGILFGTRPALMAAKAQPADALRSGSRAAGGHATLIQRGLVVAQTALSLILLIAAGLFVQSLYRMQHTDLRMDARNRFIVHFNPQTAGYLPSQVGTLYREIEQRFQAIPGVLKVGISTYTPMELWNDGWTVQVQGGQPDLGVHASAVRMNSDYFDAVGTRVLQGRGVTPQDTPASTSVAVVNQSFVRKLFKPGENPIGRHFGTGVKSASDYEIVGVVDDTVYTTPRWKEHPMYFVPILQRPPSDKTPVDEDDDMYARTIVLETAHPIGDFESITRRTLASINPNLAIVKFEPFSQQISDQFNDDRTIARLTTFFGALALLLATIGLYGVTAYTVSRRTGEIGIRMALGAQRTRVIRLVLRGAVAQILLGLAIGVPVALLCVRFVRAILYDVTSVDAAVLATAVLSMIAAASLAALIPARRAASIDPVQALRTE